MISTLLFPLLRSNFTHPSYSFIAWIRQYFRVRMLLNLGVTARWNYRFGFPLCDTLKSEVDVVAAEPGPKSDISLFREYRSRFHPKQRFKADLAYIGEDLVDTPNKKPRNGELTTEQKEENTKFASKRIFIEHRIRSIKILCADAHASLSSCSRKIQIKF